MVGVLWLNRKGQNNLEKGRRETREEKREKRERKNRQQSLVSYRPWLLVVGPECDRILRRPKEVGGAPEEACEETK